MKSLGALAAAVVFSLALCAQASGASAALRRSAATGHGGRVIELYINGSPYTGGFYLHGAGPLNRTRAISASYHALYIAEVMPGGRYSVGLSFPAKGAEAGFRVSLFDRWPYVEKARRVELPMGPTVRTARERVEYRWEVDISPRSTGTVLYILVEAGGTGAGEALPRHTVFIVTPPTKPSSTRAAGITFLQGPMDFVLTGERMYVAYEVEMPEAAPPRELPVPPLPGDLIRNGRFIEGLKHWTPHVEYETREAGSGFFSLGPAGLKIRSKASGHRAGLLQVIDADVRDAGSVMLRAVVKATKQTLAGTGPEGEDAPIAVAVCYEDVEGGEHCGGSAFRKGFYFLDPEDKGRAADGQKVSRGVWYRFMADLMELDPRPAVIRYVSLEGSGWAEREGWVREIHLLKRRSRR
ncbi:MAG: hypothetical protein ACE5GY_06500 [Thermodesulfobacteriota bacterium]